MDNALKLRVMFDMIDGITKPLKTMLAGNKGLASSLKETRRELADMGKTQKDVGKFREMHAGLTNTSTKLNAARGRVKELAGSLRAFGPPSQQMTGELAKARQAASQLGAEQKKQTAGLQEMRERLAGAGIDTRNLSQHERELRTNIAATTATMNAQMGKLDAISERERKLATARKSMKSIQGVAAGMAVGGYAARSTGMDMLGGMHESLDEAKKVQNERGRITALGLGDHATKDAEAYVRKMDATGTSLAEKMTLMRDSMSIFADEHHAQMAMPTLTKMKFANEAMFGGEQGHENEEKFMNMLKVIELRGGTKNEATFKSEANMVQKVLSATGGRVGGDEWRNFIQTGKTAAKQMRQDAFFYQMEPLIQEMGGHAAGTGVSAAYSNLMQGKTTVRAAKRMVDLGLVDKKSVEYTTTGTVKRIKPNALIGHELYNQSPFEWMEKVLLPKLAAKGITDKEKVLSEFATIMTNGNGANLFSTMYLQRDQIHKSERLNKGAYGIDDLDKLGREQTEGKELAALSKLKDLKEEMGEKIIPIYNAALDKTSSAVDKINGFMKEHQTASRVILVTLAALAALLVVAGTLTIVLAGILGPMAVLKFSMTTLGMKGGMLRAVFGGLSSLLRGGVVGSLRIAGQALMLLGRLAMANPLIAVISLIALGTFLIWKNWDTLGPKFAKMWAGIKAGAGKAWDWVSSKWGASVDWVKEKGSAIGDGISAGWDRAKQMAGGVVDGLFADMQTAANGGLLGIGALILNWSPLGLFYKAFAGVLSWFGIDMPATFTEFGANLLSGLVNGITSGLGAVKDAITGVADSTVGWFKEKLGIHSPSRVFGELGGFIGQGAAIGMEGEQGRVAKAAIGLATIAATSFGMPALAKGTAIAQAASVPIVRATVPIDTRPPLTAAPAAASAVGNAAPAAFGPITIHIHAAPGMDPAEIGRMVRAELERATRSQQARRGSSLSDQ
ncbi:hypothetical protein [Burkholderia sp. 9120]|uniref:phage tail tape measure protein n=1 Tax=Burkholderia sp. 9120 TaxID=1500897 RepID=UPI0005599836|nr:hypothetical protein [Burkholderia sp. 9120]